MLIKKKRIELNKIKTATHFAKAKKIDRKWVYPLMNQDIIDYVLIDGVKFVYLSQKSKKYKKKR
jgi:hypothetical protein